MRLVADDPQKSRPPRHWRATRRGTEYANMGIVHDPPQPATLDDSHRAEFHASGIPDELIERGSIRTVENPEVRDVLGWQPKSHDWGRGYVIPALEGGQADYGIAEAAPVVQAVAKGAKVKAFGVFMDVSTSGLASLEPYPTPRSVAGQTLAAAVTDSARIILPIIFGLEGLDPATIDWVAADPSIYFPLLLQGRARLITASADSDVPTLRHRARGKTIYFSSFADWGYDVFGYFLVARADHIEAAPDEVRSFAAATAKSVRYATDHPEEAARILVAHNPTLDPELMLEHWRQSTGAIETAYVAEHGYGHATPERLQRSIDLVKKAFELDEALAPEDIYADGFMPR